MLVKSSEPKLPRPGKASPEQMKLALLGRQLGNFLYRYGSEVQLHAAMAQVLDDHLQHYSREFQLDKKNRADFWLGGIVIEVKVDGTLAEALRQVDRYINLPHVTGVLLASTQRWADTPLAHRPEWSGKAFQMVRLRRQAL